MIDTYRKDNSFRFFVLENRKLLYSKFRSLNIAHVRLRVRITVPYFQYVSLRLLYDNKSFFRGRNDNSCLLVNFEPSRN